MANPNKCIVLLIDPHELSFFRPGRDLSWTRLSGPDYKVIADVVILGGNIVYAVKYGRLKSPENKSSMISFEISDSLITAVDKVALVIHFCPSVKGHRFMCHSYLVRWPCSDDLLQVEVHRLGLYHRITMHKVV